MTAAMNIHEQTDISTDPGEIKALAALITELNISRRNFKSYPKGHPVVETGFQKVITLYNNLLDTRDEIAIGVAKDTLMFGTVTLEKSNLVYRDFARILFDHSIGVLTLKRGLTTTELRNFNLILGLKREEINRHGGIQELWDKGQIKSLAIKPIRYDLFTASSCNTQEDVLASGSTDIWERFTRELMSDNSDSLAAGDSDEIDPEMLAAMLNTRFAGPAENAVDSGRIFESIIDVMQQASGQKDSNENSWLPYKKLGAFVGKLNADLRRQFLSSTFDINKQSGTPVAENIINTMPTEAILDTLEDLNRHQVSVPPVIMGLLQKLSAHASGDRHTSHSSHHVHETELKERMRTIFREHASEEYVPDDYQIKLNTIITENNIPLMAQSDQDKLLATVESRQVENRISDIIMNIVMGGGETPEERDFFLQNLSDMFGYFLQTGDYGQLLKMIDQSKSSSFPVDIQYYLRENYARREFLDEILNGLTIWGKPRYNDIQQLVSKIGSPFIEVLLDHLATEESMSLRRFMMDRLIEMGHATKVPIANRLDDERWFVLRNLLIILKSLNDPAIIPLVRPLSRHSNSRVRNEALSALVMLNDPAAEKQILRDLDSQDREVQLAAIALSEKSHFPDIHKKLVAMLSKSGLSLIEYELKSAIVKTLGELHRAEALTEFAKILGSTSLFNSKLLTRLKIDIIRALEHYPYQSVAPLLERLGSGKDDVAIQARESIKLCKGASHER
jgi:hypothetical protein